ncbi:hypothetical protein PF001_g24806 [Phytophthora fragariae]|uniref:Uncharacterized protein n=1 Tax=Phytophthora fragariae TaxID=53985 RepID=A0A6A4C105_9STRA|nr:hypothetical protein PF001_g24806 [Phytophthora fragariae]
MPARRLLQAARPFRRPGQRLLTTASTRAASAAAAAVLLAVLFAQLGHYHDPQRADSVRKATGIIAATAARRLLSHRCDPACANKVKPCSTKLLAPPPPPLLLIIDLCALPGHCVGFVGVGEVPLVPTSCSSASPRR